MKFDSDRVPGLQGTQHWEEEMKALEEARGEGWTYLRVQKVETQHFAEHITGAQRQPQV